MDPTAPSVAPDSGHAAETRFRRLYADHGRDVFAYALRRVDDREDAADVLSETFLVAWRRVEEVPAGEEARLWLYGVARLTLFNQRRGERRRRRLGERLRSEVGEVVDGPGSDEGGEVAAALERLEPGDRELLRLTAWEELGPGEVARVLGISSVAARSRLHRARRRLRRELDSPPDRNLNTSKLKPEEGR